MRVSAGPLHTLYVQKTTGGGGSVSDNEVRKVIIIGGGPAGFTAALYTGRANLEPLVIEGFQWGGQLMNTSDVENYPGYVDGILGPEMMKEFRAQAARFGATFVSDDVVRVDFSQRPFVVATEDAEYRAESIIIATGATARELGFPQEKAFQGRGVSYCAVCDAPFFRDRPVVVVGGGDSAFEEATYIAKFASKVFLVHRREEFRASQIMVDRAKATENLEFILNAEVADVAGSPALETVRLRSTQTGEEWEIEAGGLFVAIGHDPTTALFKAALNHDEAGYLVTEPGSTRTNIPGVFAAGDVQDHTYRQAVTAAGSGCMAALDAERFLAALEGHPGTASTAPRPEAAEV
jgi:thioredoxin reductase (NADPH)